MSGIKISGSTGGTGLNFTANLSIEQAKKNAKELMQLMKQIGDDARKSATAGMDVKPLTDYQQKQLELKQQVVDLAKAKQEADRADKQAALERMQALRDERLAREQINTQIAKNRLAAQEAAKPAPKRVTEVSNSQTEVDAYMQGRKGSMLYTSAINAQTVAKARLNAESARQAAITGSLSPVINASTSAAQQQAAATNKVTLSKKELAQMLAEEKYRQQQSTAELKNNAREMMNAKGSLEQRKAALERLVTAYGRLSVAERSAPAGERMAGIIKGLRDQVKGLEDQTKSSQGGISGLFDILKSGILSTLGPIALVTAAWTALKAAFSHNVEISDEFVDVQRTAKLSADEVDRLGEKLKTINTRTSLEGLLDIGFIGGRLGVAKEDMVGFITTLDQLSVVLKKEFPGGADAVATALGKIITVYKITQREGISLEQALKNTGSTFLELAHNGQVTVQYLQDFALRTAGVAQVAKISLPTMLSYGAVLSQAGITAQVAGSSVTRLISSLSTKREKYFAIAQLADSTLTLEKFTNLINTDTKSALEVFFKGLKAGNPTQTEFGDRLATLALTTGAAKNAVIALAENQDLLFEKTKLANKANTDGTSVAHNFELANNSLAASFDKLGNRIANAFTSSSAARRLAELLNSITDNRTEAEKLTEEYGKNKHRLEELDSTLKPLVSKYDQLKKAGKLNAEQQAELREVTAKIGELLPGVTNKFDDYGNAIDINRGKVQQLTKAQRELLELQNREVLKKANQQFDNAQRYLPEAKREALELQAQPRTVENKIYDFLYGGNQQADRRQAAKDRITGLSGRAYEAAKAIRALGGELTKAQQDVINYYEVLNKPKKTKPTPATITGDGSNEDLATDTTRTIDDIKADIKRITELKKPLDTASNQYKAYVEQLKALKKELKLANGGVDTDAVKAENEYKTALKSRNTLQGQINALTKKGTDKQLTADEQEVESVRKKYADMLDAARKFNNNPENKKKGLRVDGSGLMKAQDSELVAVRDKQATEKLKVTLDTQKKLYDEYEAYKLKVGKENADKLYADQLDTNVNYLESLQAKRDHLLNGDEKAKGGSEVDKSAVQLQLKLVEEEIAAEKLAQKMKNAEIYADAYQAAMTHSQAVLAIDAEYQLKVRALGNNATQEQIGNLKRQRDERIRYANEANAYAKSGFDELMQNYDELTRGQVLKRLEAIKDGYLKEYTIGSMVNGKLVKLTSEQFEGLTGKVDAAIKSLYGNNIFKKVSAAIQKLKDAKAAFDLAKDGATKTDNTNGEIDAQKNLYDTISDSAGEATKVISGLASSFQQLGIGGDDLQDTFKNVEGVISGVGSIAKGLATSNPIDVITGSIGFLSSAISLFSHKDKDLEKKILNYQRQLNALTQSYKQLDRAVQNSVGEDVYSNQASQIRNLQEQQKKLAQMRDAEASKKKADQGKIDDYNNQIADIPNQIEDINKAISQNLIQTTFKDLSKSLADAFAEAFASGESSAKKFEEVFNQVIVNAVKNSLQLKLLDPVISDFTDDLTEYAKLHDNSVVGFDFDTWKKAIKEKGELYTKGLEAVKDYLPDPNDSGSSSSAAGRLSAALTEDTATRVFGVLSGTQLATVQIKDAIIPMGKTIGDMYQIAVQQFNAVVQIERNTRRTAANTEVLPDMLTEMKSLNKSGDNLNAMLRAAGK